LFKFNKVGVNKNPAKRQGFLIQTIHKNKFLKTATVVFMKLKEHQLLLDNVAKREVGNGFAASIT
jgi:hypothetical protein